MLDSSPSGKRKQNGTDIVRACCWDNFNSSNFKTKKKMGIGRDAKDQSGLIIYTDADFAGLYAIIGEVRSRTGIYASWSSFSCIGSK